MRFNLLILFFSLAVSVFLYGNTLSGEFIWDDHFFAGRPELRDPGYLAKFWIEPLDVDVDSPRSYRPLLTFTSALNFILTGESPLPFHVVNIILNAVVVFLVYLLVYKLFASKRLALFSALLFAFFPIHTEVVAQIKSRDELLAAAFILLAHLVFLKGTEERAGTVNRKLIFVSSVLFLAAVFAKEFMIVVPAVFLVIFWVRRNPALVTLIKTGLVFFPVTVLYLFMRYLALGAQMFGPTEIVYVKNPLFYTDWWLRIGTGLKAVFLYVFKTFVPYDLSATYAYNHFSLVVNPFFSLEAMMGLALFAVLGWFLYRKKLRQTVWVHGLLIFLIPIFLASNLVLLVTDLFAERWAYYPSLGLALMAGYALNFLYARYRYITLGILSVLLIAYGGLTIERNTVWASNEIFYKQAVADAPDSVHARYMLANYFQSISDFEAAKPHIEHGLSIYRHSFLVEIAAIQAFQEGNYPLAKELALEVLEELRPRKPQRAHLVYAVALAHEGQYQRSLDLVRRVIQKGEEFNEIKVKGSQIEFAFQEDNPVIRFILAVNLYKLGRIEEAKKYFDWDPRYSEEEKLNLINEF